MKTRKLLWSAFLATSLLLAACGSPAVAPNAEPPVPAPQPGVSVSSDPCDNIDDPVSLGACGASYYRPDVGYCVLGGQPGDFNSYWYKIDQACKAYAANQKQNSADAAVQAKIDGSNAISTQIVENVLAPIEAEETTIALTQTGYIANLTPTATPTLVPVLTSTPMPQMLIGFSVSGVDLNAKTAVVGQKTSWSFLTGNAVRCTKAGWENQPVEVAEPGTLQFDWTPTMLGTYNLTLVCDWGNGGYQVNNSWNLVLTVVQ
jgi:hypothetical protein